MAISTTVDITAAAIFRPRDLRDPLGWWGGRVLVTGDASGGGITVGFVVPAEIAGAYIYTCYIANQGQIAAAGVLDQTAHKVRLLTNWPNVDPQAGVQGLNAVYMSATRLQTDFTGQRSAAGNPTDNFATDSGRRYILLFDPRPTAGQITIVEMEWGANTDTDTYIFEAGGYFWDRQVLNWPGGIRHPGAD